MILPASNAVDSGLNPASPWAITSALTKAPISTAPCKTSGAADVFPAPFGPAMTTVCGRLPAFVRGPPATSDRADSGCMQQHAVAHDGRGERCLK